MTRRTDQIRMRSRLPPTVLLLFLLLAVWCLHDSHAYVRIDGNPRWPNARVTVYLNLGSAWNRHAVDALARWNRAGSRFRFLRGSQRSRPACNGRENRNVTAVWTSDICGRDWGGVLAMTLSKYRGSTITNADVLFNRSLQWDAFTGRGQRNGRYDFRRTALHEFGHVLGLDHADKHHGNKEGQNPRSVMRTFYGNQAESLQADDINGIRDIYGTSGNGGSDDDFGNRWQDAAVVRLPSDTRGRLDYGGDRDYFKVTVPRSGTLTVETSGRTDTYGSLWVGGRWLNNDDSGPGRNFRIRHQATARTYYILVRGYRRSTTGSYTLHVRFTRR